MQAHFKRRHVLVLAAMVAFAASAFAQGPDRAISVQEIQSARETAANLLETMDKAPLSKFEFDNFYASGGEALKKRYTDRSFNTRMMAVRPPLGMKAERTFYGYSGPYASLPNLIPGDYVIVAFRTKFSKSAQLYTEQVTLEHDRGGAGSWKFVEYYSAPIDSDGASQ